MSVNIAVTGAADGGFVTAWPCGARPGTAAVNYERGDADLERRRRAAVATGALCLYTYSAAHVIVDVNGWWA